MAEPRPIVLRIFLHDRDAGRLSHMPGGDYGFEYLPEYDGPPLSVTLPVSERSFTWTRFPPFFEGLLPEGVNLESLLKDRGLSADDAMGQLLAVGADTVGAITVEAAADNGRDT